MAAKKQISQKEIIEQFYSPTTSLTNPIKKSSLDKESIFPFSDVAFNESDLQFYIYDKGAWLLLSDKDPKLGNTALFVESFLNDYFPTINTTTNKLIEIKESLFRACRNRFESNTPPEFIVFDDSSFSLKTFETVPHTRSNFALLKFPFSYHDLFMATPHFDNYLAGAFPDITAQTFVWDMLGYLLLPSPKEPAAFYLYGQPRTGKSVFMRTLYDIFPKQYTASFSLQSLTTKGHTVAELSNTFINILDEDESTRISSDKFKALIDCSPTEARRLYSPPFTIKPFAKYILSSNKLPNFKYVDGLERRLHFIHFVNVIAKDKQDKELSAKIATEIPGIVGRAIIHAKVFVERNQEFIFPVCSEMLKKEFTHMVVPAYLFVDERCRILAKDSPFHSWSSNADLYSSYRSWCDDAGHHALARQNFLRQLSSHPEVKTKITSGERRKNLSVYDTADKSI